MVKVKLDVLTSDDCFQCRRCCRFTPDEFIDAPLFTDDQRHLAEAELAGEEVEFVPRGGMWQVVLREIPGSESRVCPFYEERMGRCRVYTYGIFDCDTWPFYVMERDGRLLLTLSRDCPVVGAQDVERLRTYARHCVAPQMLAITTLHPELIATYRANVIELLDLGTCVGSDANQERP